MKIREARGAIRRLKLYRTSTITSRLYKNNPILDVPQSDAVVGNPLILGELTRKNALSSTFQ